MPLMPAICTQCKGALTVDPKEKSGVCPYCGTTFLNQDVINNYNITNVQNNVTNIGNLHADVVNVQDSKSADNLYKKAVTYLNFKDFNAAFTAFDEMTKTYPYDHRGWKGIILAYTRNLDKNFFVEANTVNWVKYYYDLYVKAKNFSGIVIENDPTDKYYAFAKQCAINNINAECERKISEYTARENDKYGPEAKESARKDLARYKARKKELEKLKKKTLGKMFLKLSIVMLIVAIIPSILINIGIFNDFVDTMERHGIYDVFAHFENKWFLYEIFMDQSWAFPDVPAMITHGLILYTLIFFVIFMIPVTVVLLIKNSKKSSYEKYSKEEYEKLLETIKGNELFVNGSYDSINKWAAEAKIKSYRDNAQKEISLIQ